MAEYIDRNRLKEAFTADLQTLQSLDEHTMNLIIMDIDEAPLADVAPVVHAKWETDNETGEKYCTHCFEDAIFTSGHYYFCGEYCPNCGARMDGDTP